MIAEDAAIMRDGLTQTLTRRGHDVVAAVADAALTPAGGARRTCPTWPSSTCGCPPAIPMRGCEPRSRSTRIIPGSECSSSPSTSRPGRPRICSPGSPAGVGYLLKDRVADVSDFIDAITRVAQGGTVLDPEVVRQLLGASRRADSLATLTPREREVLSLIAQGRSNAAIASTLVISAGVVEKHVASVFAKLGLAPSDNDNRRVIAALKYLGS